MDRRQILGIGESKTIGYRIRPGFDQAGFSLVLLRAIQIIDPSLGRQSVDRFTRGVDHANSIIVLVPIDMDRFAGRFSAPVSAVQIVIIVKGLPNHGRISRHAHPDDHTCRILITVIQEAFEHGLHRLDIEQLGISAEILDSLRPAIAVVYVGEIVGRTCVSGKATKEMLVPQFVVRPEALFRHKLLKAIQVRKRGHADFTSVPERDALDSFQANPGEIIFQIQVTPRPAPA